MRLNPGVTPLLLALLAPAAQAQVVNDSTRPDKAKAVRDAASAFQRGQPQATHQNNNDLQDFGRWAVYTKGLNHNTVGETSVTQFDALLDALLTGDPAKLEAVVLEGPRKLVNPQAGFSYVLEGADPQAITLGPAPDFNSAEVSGEMIELYWMSQVRDVRFDQYGGDGDISSAAIALTQARVYRGARDSGGFVRPATLFRADLPGAVQGPYVSQFLLKTVPVGGGPLAIGSETNPPPVGVEPTAHQPMEQRIWTRFAGDDRVTAYNEWRAIQNGALPADPTDTLEDFDPVRRYIRNGRDLAEWVHFDYPLQSSLNAAFLLARQGDFLPDGRYDPDPKSSPRAEDPNNPYRTYAKQEPFVTFGNSDVQSVTSLVTNTTLRAQWFQKWQVHRRLRPEEYGGLVHIHKWGERTYPIPEELLNAPVLQRVFQRNLERNVARGLGSDGTYLLSQTFPEGSPLHPAYGSGHSTYIGAGVTALKAFYADFPVINPQVPNADGTALVPYSGTLMMFDELDKLTSNVGMARLFAGVHYRSDHDNALRLGELYALRTLQDWSRLYPERLRDGTPFQGFQVRTFGGNTVTVNATSPALPNAVSRVDSFTLLDAYTKQPIAGFETIHNGMVLDFSDLAARGHTQFIVRANTYPQNVGSVRFVINGVTRIRSTYPYYLGDGQDDSGQTVPLGVGNLVITATPYSGPGATGIGGVPFTGRGTVQN
ncbi:hypothetical protein HPC49_41525 [Pyxidicoccus fallax]|uniref:Phosphatidic acid phosphatase type 2/haloperoxidase domain-containing protein n=1 Tax=Pyxidicoccus fallax TaxID=394095 RepID=A0A848LRX1_9BACT|nr:hypothetical protein [Pyxidicoccus fallax]NMO20382.1 hypothetical protein [Pyxidicoccus fallax]NPC84685.1 hypothetical protein [Pyxidicoccus fallax]